MLLSTLSYPILIVILFLKNHILFLTSEKNAGRYPGGKANKRVVKYLIKEFKKTGVNSFDLGYYWFAVFSP